MVYVKMEHFAATFSKWLQPSFDHPDEGFSTVVTFKRGYQALIHLAWLSGEGKYSPR